MTVLVLSESRPDIAQYYMHGCTVSSVGFPEPILCGVLVKTQAHPFSLICLWESCKVWQVGGMEAASDRQVILRNPTPPPVQPDNFISLLGHTPTT